jgi:hypothetical protein
MIVSLSCASPETPATRTASPKAKYSPPGRRERGERQGERPVRKHHLDNLPPEMPQMEPADAPQVEPSTTPELFPPETPQVEPPEIPEIPAPTVPVLEPEDPAPAGGPEGSWLS